MSPQFWFRVTLFYRKNQTACILRINNFINAKIFANFLLT